jgi:hypothetical protein
VNSTTGRRIAGPTPWSLSLNGSLRQARRSVAARSEYESTGAACRSGTRAGKPRSARSPRRTERPRERSSDRLSTSTARSPFTRSRSTLAETQATLRTR